MAMFYVLLIFIIIAALIAVETQDLLSAVICLGAVGFFISLMIISAISQSGSMTLSRLGKK